MRKYLSTLHRQPDYHKRSVALLVSSVITLFIFGVWSLATFGMDREIVAKDESEVSPLQSLRTNVASSLEALKSNFGELKSGLKAVDWETQYQEMKDGALDVYGQ